MPWTGVNGARIAAVPHVAVLDADPPVFGYSIAQRRCRAGQVHVLVADLPGGRHRRGCGLLAGRGGNKRLHKIKAQHLGQSLVPGGRVIPVRIQRGLQAGGGGQLRRPSLCFHDGGPGGLPQPCTTAITPRALPWACLIKLNVSSLDWLDI